MKTITFISIALAAAMLSSCKSGHSTEEQEIVYPIANPVIRDTTIYKEYVCQIKAIQHIELRALEKGYLKKIYVDEGKMVKKGQILFQIMPMMYEAEMQKAKAEANFAEIEYKNAQKLSENNIISPNELALIKAKLDKANAELQLTQTQLAFTEIRAPFDGLIGRFNDVRLGSLVDEGDLLTTLSDNSKIWVYFNVPESEYLTYQKQQHISDAIQVKLKMANNELFNQMGTVETIEADFNNETGNIAFRATFLNPEGTLRHGETGNILLPVILNHALLIPQKATFEVLDKKYVYVVDANQVVHAKEITIATEMPNIYAVSDGLSKDDHLLIDGIRKVRNGDKINTRPETFDAIISEMKHLKAE